MIIRNTLRVAIVTGAARGIGKASAVRLIADGFRVVLADVDENALAAAHADLPAESAIIVRTDVTDSKSVDSMVESTIEHFGRVDALVNCAGVIGFAPAFDLTEAEWNRVIGVNLTGAFLCCSSVIGRFVSQGSGSIVNVSSIAGKTAGAYAAHYCASKAGLIGLTQALARELSEHSFRVNAVCPGFIETDMLDAFLERQAAYQGTSVKALKAAMVDATGWNRLGSPKDVASVVAFLLSDDAEFMTGQALNVAGIGEVH